MVKFMFDAGHAGKYNQSPLVPEYYESDMVWKLQTYIVEEFKNYKDVVVDITRPNQSTDVDVFNRGSMAKGYDYFESLHSNATGNAKTIKEGDKNEKVNRVDVYCPLDKRNKSHTLGKKLATEIAALMGVSSGNVKTREYPNKPGVEYYGVMRGAQSVGVPMYVLTEHSFHTNVAAAKWLLDDSNLKKLAKLKVEILADWYKLEKVKDTTNESVKLEPKPNTETKEEVYVVKSGDTLSEIADKYNTAYQELAKYNNIENPSKIYVGQKIRIPAKVEVKEEDKTEVSYKFEVDAIVNFKGDTHYGNANAASGSSCKPGKAKITARYNGKHKYHLIAEKDGKSSVYGWVDESDIELFTETKPSQPATESKIEVGDMVRVKASTNKFSNGVSMKAWVKSVNLYVRNIESNGTIYLLSTHKTARTYTGRVKASDVYKV